MAQEHAKLSSLAMDSEKNEKTEHRLKLLREGFAYLQKKCRTEFNGNASDKEIVDQFLDQCLNAMR
jgi:cell division protein FtsB